MTLSIENRKAPYQYELFERFVSGIVLKGTEIKSIRSGQVNLSDAWCHLKRDGSLLVRNLHIAPYARGTHYNHDPLRPRQLLLRKSELRKIGARLKERGYTLVPTRLFISDRGWAKLEIALAKGKKTHDKRETIRRRELSRHLRNREQMQ